MPITPDTSGAAVVTELGSAAYEDVGTASGEVALLSTGGRFPIARIASGTPDGTKFVRDDGTLAAPAGGSADKLGLTPTAVKTSAYTAAVGDLVPVDTTAGSFTVTLPDAPTDGSVIGLTLVAGTNAVGYSRSGSDVFDVAGGAVSDNLAYVGQSILFQYKTGIWYRIGPNLPRTAADARYYLLAAESHADISVVNSTTETAVVDLTLPASAVVLGDVVRLTAIGDCLNQSGSTATWTPKVKFGTTTALTGAAISRATNSSRLKWFLQVHIAIQAGDAQRVGAFLNMTAPSANNFDSIAAATSYVGYGTAGESILTAKAVQFTITPSAAHASLDWVTHASSLEVIKKR